MKNEKMSTGFLISTIAFFAAAVTAVPLRTIQMFTNIEPGSGFYINKADNNVYILYFILIVCLLISLASSLVYRKEIGFDRTAEKRPVLGGISILTAVSVLYKVAVDLNSILKGTVGSGIEPQKQRIALIILCAVSVAGLLSALYFVVFGVSMISGSTNGSEYKVLSLAPIIWYMFRLIYLLPTSISFIKVSQLTFTLFMLSFMLLFFTAFAQLNSKIESKGIDWKIVGYGLPAAALGLVTFVPGFVITVMGKTDMLYTGTPVEFCDLTTAVFALTVVLTRMGWVGGNADAREEAAAEAEGDADNSSVEEASEEDA